MTPRNPRHDQPMYPYAVFTAPPQRRQSCLIHAALLVTTLGVGNIVYSVWHRHKYDR
jgi:hypothetical protein